MTSPIPNQPTWTEILRQQKLANVQRWLKLLEQESDLSAFIQTDYDNLLRALETSLEKNDSFDLAYKLIIALNPVVLGYADWDRWLQYLQKP